MKNIPMRKCVGCLESKPKKELCRIVKNKDACITVDKTGKAEGRGAYICFNEECLNKAIKSKRLQKEFNMDIEDNIFEKLKEMINNGK